MKLNVFQVPFSRYGSYIVISPLEYGEIKKGLYIRNIRGGDDDLGEVFRIETVYNENIIPYKIECSETLMQLNSEEGFVKICMPNSNTVRIHSEGIVLRLIMKKRAYDDIIKAEKEAYEVNCSSKKIRFMINPIIGEVKVRRELEEYPEEIVIDLLPHKGVMDFSIEDYHTVWKEKKDLSDFNHCLKAVEEDYNSWLENTLNVPERYSVGKSLASYITWSCVVNPEGFLKRPAMYMSKNWMTNIWSWDHCFNAMALVKNNPELAWDQFMAFIDVQDESGTFPDFINDRFALWNYCKPPIHGWTLKWMMDRCDFITEEKIKEVYEPLCKWTDWWLKYRDYDKDGVPQYNHGNDSGWDNATIFKESMAVESPDLCAFLIIQMDVLEKIANKLGKKEEACEWRIRGEELLNKMIKHFWRKDRFVAVDSYTHEDIESDSLILYVPLILGKRLNKDIRNKLLEKIKKEGDFLTEFGLATEKINSEYYIEDGYWRGPIWAPSTMILVYALNECGEYELAKKVAERFCSMANKNGMAENFNALTGEGLRDTAFTWTSSVFLVLCNEYI
ncbi:trehalase family glycosidase [Clostridium sp. KNHs214]|uniref:amylo-alpha-1,6-glucosidase n=1 Tax=Clostridium sp. KNHs214 TaxID=1540257 RepID=UPI0005536D6D|nr:trehalase family glycosidase [Clostridium sp. KNHs214]